MSGSAFKRVSALLIAAAVLLISGCVTAPDGEKTSRQENASSAAVSDAESKLPEDNSVPEPSAPEETEPEISELEPEKYEFDPHLYVPLLAEDIPADYWEAFYNLCDALRNGESSFACKSEEAYNWATSPATLNELFPAACTKITGKSGDGTKSFENGTGRIYYLIPTDEYVERQAKFEAFVENVLNTCLEPDDGDFEKCLKLYDYMESNYSYDYDFAEEMPDGANYLTMMTGKGECIELSGVYAYFLLQAGVEAFGVGCTNDKIAHAWNYLVIDGTGYFSDPTWALKSESGRDELDLYYFLMDGTRRSESGCDVGDDMTAPLLPRYWFSSSNTRISADSDEFCFPSGAALVSLDEGSKTVHYLSEATEYELSYAE